MPTVASRMLNGQEAQREFPTVDYRQLYAWVECGRLHAVLIGKRWHYPEWELRELVAEADTLEGPSGGPSVKATYPGRFSFGSRSRRAA